VSRATQPLPREVRVLVAVAFFVALGFGIVAPALPVFARDFGVGRAAAGAVISVFAVMRILGAFPAGIVIDRVGERIVMTTGIAIVAASSVLAGLAQNYAQLITLRGIGGLGSAMFSVSALSLLVRMVPNQQRGRAMGMWQGGFLIGGITGPVLGSAVTGVSIRLPFFLYAGTLALAGTTAIVALRSTPLADKAAPGSVPQTTLRQALRDRAYRAALIANFADSWGAIGVRSALIPLFVIDVLHKHSIYTGLGFLVVTAVNGTMLLPAANYADRFGRKPLLLAGCVGSGLGIGLLALEPNLVGYFVGLALLGFGSGLLDVAPGAVVGDIVEGRSGPVFAAYSMSSDVGTVFGPVIAGKIADTSYSAAFGTTAGILGLAAMFAAVAPETLNRNASPPQDPSDVSPVPDGGTSATTAG
jgi:MFS family permease